MICCFFEGPCDFESGLCNWKDTSLGVYQWSRNKGSTVATGTGPSIDHTCGNASCELPFTVSYSYFLHPSKLAISLSGMPVISFFPPLF